MDGNASTGGDKKADLVLEGGGVKGIGLLGAVLALADAGYTFPRVAGTSAGAIVTALVAAYQTAGLDATSSPCRIDVRPAFPSTAGQPGSAGRLNGGRHGGFWLRRQVQADRSHTGSGLCPP